MQFRSSKTKKKKGLVKNVERIFRPAAAALELEYDRIVILFEIRFVNF